MKKTLLILVTIGAAAAGVAYYEFRPTQPVGRLVLEDNKILHGNIDTFMEHSSLEAQLDDAPLTCSTHVFGYDESHAYAFYHCGHYASVAGRAEAQSDSVGPVRFEILRPSFVVKRYDVPRDGNLYGPTWRKLFPKNLYDMSLDFGNTNKVDALIRESLAKATTAIVE